MQTLFVFIHSKSYFAVAQHLVDPERWKLKTVFHNGDLDNNFVPDIPFNLSNAMDFMRYITNIQLNETFSDECILELLQGIKCNVSYKCLHEMRDKQGFGPLYVTTHR